MTSLFAARRAAEEFADLVESHQPDVTDRYATLGGVVTLLREQPPVTARPEFVTDLRGRLLAAAEVELAPSAPVLRPVPTLVPGTTPPGAFARPRRLGTAAAVALAVVGGTTGLAAASSNALPGDGLYSVKRSIETATAAMNTTDAGKGADLLRQAGTRLEEIAALSAADGDAADIRAAVADFVDTAHDGAGLLFRSYQSTGRSSDIATVRDFTADQGAALRSLAASGSVDSPEDLAPAASALEQIEGDAQDLCAGCGGSGFDDAEAGLALQSLLTAPAAPPARSTQARQSSLAAQAEQAAGEVALQPAPTAPAPEVTAPDAGPTPTNPLEPVRDTVRDVTGPLTGPLGPVLDPVTGVVDDLGEATGLTPVTDPLTGILDGLGSN